MHIGKRKRMVGMDESEFEYGYFHEPANPWLWMIKNMLSVEMRSVGLSCRRNKILRGSTPAKNLMVKMQITELGVQSEDHRTWRMRARTCELKNLSSLY
jgi:hypothetical protein